MDYVKLLTRAAIRSVVFLAILIFLVNGVIAGFAPDFVASIPVELSLPIIVSTIIAFLGLDWLEKSFLRKYM